MIFYVEISVIFRVCENALYDLVMNCLKKCFHFKNYGSRSKKGEIPRFELSHNALNRKPQK